MVIHPVLCCLLSQQQLSRFKFPVDVVMLQVLLGSTQTASVTTTQMGGGAAAPTGGLMLAA